MYHRVIIVGYLGRDPEMRYTPQGVPVTNFTVATNRRWTNQDGTQGEETVWFRVTAWRKLAEVCSEHLSKGQPVLVEGMLQPDPDTGGPRVWTGNDGKPRASYEVVARTVRFLGRRGEKGGVPEEPPPGITEENELPW